MNKIRIAIGALVLSAAALVGLATDEGYTDTAVIPVKGDVPTLGFGSITHADGSPVREGDRTTPVKALQRTLAYTQKAEASFKGCVRAPLHQEEFDLYLDFSYQYGMSATCRNFAPLLNAGRYAQACEKLREFRFMTSSEPHAGWEVARRDETGRAVSWRFDCSTPGNKVCMGVWTRQLARYERCMAVQ